MTDLKQDRLRIRWPLVIAAVAFLGVGILLLLFAPRPQGLPTGAAGSGAETPLGSPEGTQVYGAPTHETVSLDVPAAAPPAIVADVLTPAAVMKLLADNGWSQDVLAKPLGRGFLGPWAGFLGSRGEDVGGRFTGTVWQLVAGELLADPFRVVWFAGSSASGAPAIIIPEPSSTAKTAFENLGSVAHRGTFAVSGCPAGSSNASAGNFEIDRWLLADHAVYATKHGDALVLASRPFAVVHAVCTGLPPMSSSKDAAIDLQLMADSFGRDAQLFAALLGIEAPAHLSFAIQNAALVPQGISAKLATPGRLGAAALDGKLLKLVPEDAPVLLTLQLMLPKQINNESLKSYFEGKDAAASRVARQAALIWYPRGANVETEIALVWSAKGDIDSLHKTFAGGNELVWGSACDQLVLASNRAMLTKLERACSGKTPSVVHASAPVVAGLTQPMSVGMVVNAGRLLSRLLVDAYARDTGRSIDAAGDAAGALPPEIDEAKRQLEALPLFGFTGAASNDVLTPRGFRS